MHSLVSASPWPGPAAKVKAQACSSKIIHRSWEAHLHGALLWVTHALVSNYTCHRRELQHSVFSFANLRWRAGIRLASAHTRSLWWSQEPHTDPKAPSGQCLNHRSLARGGGTSTHTWYFLTTEGLVRKENLPGCCLPRAGLAHKVVTASLSTAISGNTS